MKARLVALAVAIALIAVAVVIRARASSDDNSPEDDDEAAVVVCATELADLCSAIDNAVIESVADTVARLGGGADLPDAWVTFEPYPELVDQLRSAAGHEGSLGAGTTVGTTGLVAVVRESRAVITAACGLDLTWACIGELAGERWGSLVGGDASWGTVKPGHDRLDGGRGPLALAAGVSAVFGGDGWGRAELESGPGADWLRAVERAQPSFNAAAASALEQMLVLPASYDFVLTTTDQAERLVLGPLRNGFVVAYPSPMRSVNVVAAGSSAGRVSGDLAELAGDTPAGAIPLDVDGGALGALVALAGQL